MFRSVVCWVAIVAGLASLAGIEWSSSRALMLCTGTFYLTAVAMISVLTLDSNSVRVGNSYCHNRLAASLELADVTCDSLMHVSLCVADGVAVFLLWLAHMSTKASYKFVRSKHSPARLDDGKMTSV